MYSELTGNDDPRGGGCGNYKFRKEDFVWTIKNVNGITFGNLVECVYRLKGSKYDLWYEMYCGIILEKETDDGYLIEVRFDHGS